MLRTQAGRPGLVDQSLGSNTQHMGARLLIQGTSICIRYTIMRAHKGDFLVLSALGIVNRPNEIRLQMHISIAMHHCLKLISQ